jgi:hypothetical protein
MMPSTYAGIREAAAETPPSVCWPHEAGTVIVVHSIWFQCEEVMPSTKKNTAEGERNIETEMMKPLRDQQYKIGKRK